jgi:hypothetical protein
MAFAFFRLASILQGVYKRGLMGTASSTRALQEGSLPGKPVTGPGLLSKMERDKISECRLRISDFKYEICLVFQSAIRNLKFAIAYVPIRQCAEIN